MKDLYATFTARPGCEARLTEILLDLTDRVRAEPGNLVFDPYTCGGDGRGYVVFESYRNAAAFEDHLGSSHCAEFNVELAGLIEESHSHLVSLTRVIP